MKLTNSTDSSLLLVSNYSYGRVKNTNYGLEEHNNHYYRKLLLTE